MIEKNVVGFFIFLTLSASSTFVAAATTSYWDAESGSQFLGYGGEFVTSLSKEQHSVLTGISNSTIDGSPENPYASSTQNYISSGFYCRNGLMDCNTTSNHSQETTFWYDVQTAGIDQLIPVDIDYELSISMDLDPKDTGYVSGYSESTFTLYELGANKSIVKEVFYDEYFDNLSSSTVRVTSGQTRHLTTSLNLKPNTTYRVHLGALTFMSLHPYLEDVTGFLYAYADPQFTIDPSWAFADQVSITASLPDEIVTQTTVVPVPAAVWLFGSGLLGLIGVARRKKTA